jgi:hypothetical protein
LDTTSQNVFVAAILPPPALTPLSVITTVTKFEP